MPDVQSQRAPGLMLPTAMLAAVAQAADAQLLRLCAAFTDVHADLKAANRPRSGVSDEECDATVERWHGLVADIIVSPACSPSGLRAKARVARDVLRAKLLKDWDGPMMKPENGEKQTKDMIGWSLICDVLGEHAG